MALINLIRSSMIDRKQETGKTEFNCCEFKVISTLISFVYNLSEDQGAIRLMDYKIIVNQNNVEIYDVIEDPSEQNDLSNHADLRNLLMKAYLQESQSVVPANPKILNGVQIEKVTDSKGNIITNFCSIN